MLQSSQPVVSSKNARYSNALQEPKDDAGKIGSSAAIKINANTLSWPDDGWYEVQYAKSFNTVSEGGRFAQVDDGVYNVINHTTGVRYEGIVVGNSALPNVYEPGLTGTSPGSLQALERPINIDLIEPLYLPEIPIYTTPLTRELQHLQAQPERLIDGGLRYQNIQFVDGTRASLLNFPGMPSVMARIDADGTSSFYRVTDVGLEKLAPGSSVAPNFLGEGEITIDADGGGLTATGVSGLMTFKKASYTLDLQSGLIEGTSQYSGPSFGFNPEGGTPVESISDNIWRGSELADQNSAVGSAVHASAAFDYYSSTPEGAAILNREQSFYDRFGANEQSLFVARTRLLRDEGGIELFEEFMPKRAALLNDPVKLAEYDAQFDRMFAHVSSSTSSKSGGIPAGQLDLSLRTLIAADATEAMGHSPELISMVISDLDRGWSVANDLPGAGGRYTHWQPLFKSMKGHITLDLGWTLASFADPNDNYDVVAHEMVHSLDGFGNNGLDGLPRFSTAQDREDFLRIRSELVEDYNSDTPSLPYTLAMDYAFTNNKEFLARFSELFLTNSASAQTVRAVSPELYDLFSRFYGITYP